MRKGKIIGGVTLIVFMVGVVTGHLCGITSAAGDTVVYNSGYNVSSGATYKVNQSGSYSVRCKGGPAGSYSVAAATSGDLTVDLDLKEGDILSIYRLAGGTSEWATAHGGDAIMVALNGVYLVGAGGGGGSWETESGSFQHTGSSVTGISNVNFSSGAGGGGLANGYKLGSNGNTLSGFNAAIAAKKSGGAAGSNYVNTSICKLSLQLNNSSQVQVIVTQHSVATISKETVIKIVDERITEFISKGAISTLTEEDVLNMINKENVIQITVCQNQEFDLDIAKFDYVYPLDETVDIGSGGGIVHILNSTKDDRLIQVSGYIKTSGKYWINTGGIKIFIKVVEEPDSTNINVVLN